MSIYHPDELMGDPAMTAKYRFLIAKFKSLDFLRLTFCRQVTRLADLLPRQAPEPQRPRPQQPDDVELDNLN